MENSDKIVVFSDGLWNRNDIIELGDYATVTRGRKVAKGTFGKVVRILHNDFQQVNSSYDHDAIRAMGSMHGSDEDYLNSRICLETADGDVWTYRDNLDKAGISFLANDCYAAAMTMADFSKKEVESFKLHITPSANGCSIDVSKSMRKGVAVEEKKDIGNGLTCYLLSQYDKYENGARVVIVDNDMFVKNQVCFSGDSEFTSHTESCAFLAKKIYDSIHTESDMVAA